MLSLMLCYETLLPGIHVDVFSTCMTQGPTEKLS